MKLLFAATLMLPFAAGPSVANEIDQTISEWAERNRFEYFGADLNFEIGNILYRRNYDPNLPINKSGELEFQCDPRYSTNRITLSNSIVEYSQINGNPISEKILNPNEFIEEFRINSTYNNRIENAIRNINSNTESIGLFTNIFKLRNVLGPTCATLWDRNIRKNPSNTLVVTRIARFYTVYLVKLNTITSPSEIDNIITSAKENNSDAIVKISGDKSIIVTIFDNRIALDIHLVEQHEGG